MVVFILNYRGVYVIIYLLQPCRRIDGPFCTFREGDMTSVKVHLIYTFMTFVSSWFSFTSTHKILWLIFFREDSDNDFLFGVSYLVYLFLKTFISFFVASTFGFFLFLNLVFPFFRIISIIYTLKMFSFCGFIFVHISFNFPLVVSVLFFGEFFVV